MKRSLLRSPNNWVLFLFFWGITLACGLLGTAVAEVFLWAHSSSAFTSRLPWVVGGSLLMALCGTGGFLYSRPRRDPSAKNASRRD